MLFLNVQHPDIAIFDRPRDIGLGVGECPIAHRVMVLIEHDHIDLFRWLDNSTSVRSSALHCNSLSCGSEHLAFNAD